MSTSSSNVLFSAVSSGYYAGENSIVNGKYGIRAGYMSTLNAGNSSTFASQNRILNQSGSGWAHINTTSSSADIDAEYNYWKPNGSSGGVAPTVSDSGTVDASPHLSTDPNPGAGFKQVSGNGDLVETSISKEQEKLRQAITHFEQKEYANGATILSKLIETSKNDQIIRQSLLHYGWIARLTGESTYAEFLESKKKHFGLGENDATLARVLATVYFSEKRYEQALEKLDYINKQYPDSEHAFQASVLAAYVASASGNQVKAEDYKRQAAARATKSLATEENNRLLSDLQFYLDTNKSYGIKDAYAKEDVKMTDTKSELTISNYPNPFNPTTNIRFTLPERSKVSLVVYDMLGRKVATLVNETLPAGEQTVRFDASRLANGMYLYKLRTGNQVITRKMTLIK